MFVTVTFLENDSPCNKFFIKRTNYDYGIILLHVKFSLKRTLRITNNFFGPNPFFIVIYIEREVRRGEFVEYIENFTCKSIKK